MLKWVTKERKWIFIAGAATGLAVLGLLSTKKAREVAVKGVAGGMMLKDRVMENVANIKEEAEDIRTEAKVIAQQECDYGTACACVSEENDDE